MDKRIEVRMSITVKDNNYTYCGLWEGAAYTDMEKAVGAVQYTISEMEEYRIRVTSNKIIIVNARDVSKAEVEFREVDNG